MGLRPFGEGSAFQVGIDRSHVSPGELRAEFPANARFLVNVDLAKFGYALNY